MTFGWNRLSGVKARLPAVAMPWSARHRFRDLSLAHKVLLIPCLTLCMLGSVVAFAVHNAHSSVRALEIMETDATTPTRTAIMLDSRIGTTHSSMSALLSDRLAEIDPVQWSSNAAGVTEMLAAQGTALSGAIVALSGFETDAKLAALHAAHEDYLLYAGAMIEATSRDAGVGTAAMRAANNRFAVLHDLLADLVTNLRQRRGAMIQEMIARSKFTEAATIALSAAAAIVALLGSAWVGRGIARPIAGLTDIVTRIAQGDTTPPATGVARGDEVGDIARAVEIFRRNAIAQGESDAALRQALRHLDVALNNMSQGLCLFDRDGKLLVWNRRYQEVLGLSPDVLFQGLSYQDVWKIAADAGLQAERGLEDTFQAIEAALRTGHLSRLETKLRDGRSVAILRQALPEGGWVATIEDITEKRRHEEHIVYLARHDPLTNLPNRRLFQERLELALGRVGRGQCFAVHYLDLDRFKQVNDTMGHDTGDALLRLVAERLQASVRQVDTVARLGGDEFAILQEDIAAPESAVVLAARILEVACGQVEIGSYRVTVGTSIGIALAPDHGTSATALMKRADVALYVAKAERGRFVFFEPGMEASLEKRHALEAALRLAIEHQQFELYYQPLLSLAKDRVVGFEALIRWHQPEKGMISPLEFIPIAEETGLILPIGEWVLSTACAEAMRWPDDIKVAVNLSPVQFRGGRVLDVVHQALRTSGLPPYRLDLEITESVLMHDDEETLSILHRLRALGVGIAMDDFGTGYSSLAYLHKFPFDKIKIDRSFVADITREESGISVVRAIMALTQSLGMTTVAEGVETEEQLALLRLEGCTEVQGYLFSQPVPSSKLLPMLAIMNCMAKGHGSSGNGTSPHHKERFISTLAFDSANARFGHRG